MSLNDPRSRKPCQSAPDLYVGTAFPKGTNESPLTRTIRRFNNRVAFYENHASVLGQRRGNRAEERSGPLGGAAGLPEKLSAYAEDRPVTAQPRPVVLQEKLIIVDWDDTIFPTTFLVAMGITHNTRPSDVPKELRDALRKYAYRVKATFELLQEHGKVVIVTNARKGWIELSCANFLPEIEPLVRSFRRISAQPVEYNGDPKPDEWKEEAFAEVAQKHFADPAGQPVFSLGDAMYEREALLRTSARLGFVPQNMKLLTQPSLELLEAEHASLLEDGYLRELLGRVDGFDLYFDILDGPKPFSELIEAFAADLELHHSEQKAVDPSAKETDTPKSSKSVASTSSTTASTASSTASGFVESTAELLIEGRCCLKVSV